MISHDFLHQGESSEGQFLLKKVILEHKQPQSAVRSEETNQISLYMQVS
jgi:hypothetical protein